MKARVVKVAGYQSAVSAADLATQVQTALAALGEADLVAVTFTTAYTGTGALWSAFITYSK